MEIVIRNITKDTMRDFSNDHSLQLPMNEEQLRSLLGNDEWIIVDSPVGEELTDIIKLNRLLGKINEESLLILSQVYLIHEIEEMAEENSYIIVDFDTVTSQYQCGYGVSATDWWKGFVLFHNGYVTLPFEYKNEMEDYIDWETVWAEANFNGWQTVKFKSKTYLVK